MIEATNTLPKLRVTKNNSYPHLEISYEHNYDAIKNVTYAYGHSSYLKNIDFKDE